MRLLFSTTGRPWLDIWKLLGRELLDKLHATDAWVVQARQATGSRSLLCSLSLGRINRFANNQSIFNKGAQRAGTRRINIGKLGAYHLGDSLVAVIRLE